MLYKFVNIINISDEKHFNNSFVNLVYFILI